MKNSKLNKQLMKNNSKKKKNILVWLDFDAYSYVNFGIVNYLSKNNEFNFTGIVTTKQDISFFENQNILKFEKLFYYPECYINKSATNIEKIQLLEKKYNLNLWLDIFSERSFYKYWTDFYKFSKNEILSIVENSLSFFIELLEKNKPDLILMQHPGENISNLLLYRLAKNLGIKILFPNPTYIHNRIVISDNIENNEILNGYKKLILNYKNNDEKFDAEYIKKTNLSETVNVQSSYNSGTINFSQKFNHYIKRLSNNSEPIYKNIGKTKMKMMEYKIKNNFRVKNRSKFLEKNSIKVINDKKFLYFPLQSEPESKILTSSAFYSNQIQLIENIAKSIPIDYVLYVKEHPIQKMKMWRSIEDYKNIIKIPNVKLVNPYVNAQELIQKSSAIISISGATGFEALFYKKPVIIFADEFYEKLSSVKKIRTFRELHEEIKIMLSSIKIQNKELNALMESLENHSILVPYFSMIKDGISLSSIQRYENSTELTQKKFKEFYKFYEKSFEIIANTIYNKI
jgi:hypothetical protein